MRNNKGLAYLTIDQILSWVDEYKAAIGSWPKLNSGQVTGTYESWARINTALVEGLRGLPSGSSLAQLLAERRGVRNVQDLPPLTIKQILAWSNKQKAETGDWPGKESGAVTGTDETWGGINAALYRGHRGLPGGSSLAKLLKQRSVRSTN